MKTNHMIIKRMKMITSVLCTLLSVLFVSCEQIEDFVPQETTALRFVVSDFPAFDEGTATRAIGISDAGKTAWADGDKILVHLHSPKYGNYAATLTFDEAKNTWSSDGGPFSYLEKEKLTITAVYAPDCVIKPDKTIGLEEGKQYGMAEYILAKTDINDNTLNISFTGVSRTYSRLRIITTTNTQLTVTTTGFTPAGPADAPAPESYSLKADYYGGNAFLYGTFAENAKINIANNNGEKLWEYDFTKATTEGTSYALFAGTIVDLSTLSEPYVIDNNKNYLFKGTGTHGIEVTNGHPSIFLDNAIINVTDGNAISIKSGRGEVKIYVSGAENKMTSSNNTAVAVSNDATIRLHGYIKDRDALTAIGGFKNEGPINNIAAGAGIGSPLEATTGGNIIIENMTVHATGGEVSNYAGGAGIGSSSHGEFGYIHLNNAVVNSTGGNYAAAIGMGCNILIPNPPRIGDIEIIGCDVTATGGDNAAAIGFCRSSPNSGSGTYNAGKIRIATEDPNGLEAFLSKLQTQGSTINRTQAQRIGVGSYTNNVQPTLKNTDNDNDWEGVVFNGTKYPGGID